MKVVQIMVILGMFMGGKTSAQESSIEGTVVDASTFEPVANTHITMQGSTYETITGEGGEFNLTGDFPAGNQILVFSRQGYLTLRVPVLVVAGQIKNLDIVPLQVDMFREQLQIGVISLTDTQLSEDEGNVDNIAGLLQASRDVFLNAAAFDFSQTFFRPRGLDSEYGKVFINGVEMNKIFSGRPQWSNWGGLNDVQRNQVFTMGMVPAEVGFGGLAGSTNIIMRASKYGKGGRFSYATANRSYNGRLMATYSSGEVTGGWSYSLSISRRFAQEGFIDGTLYNANSIFVSVEKRLSASQTLNFTGFYTPNIRGKSSANTQEVFDLRGQRYNSFWGEQNGQIRNSRLREVMEPVLMINHFWNPWKNVSINTNIAYQFGKIGNSRIDFGGTRLVTLQDGQESFVGGGSNPDPAYYQKLPGYFLRNPNNPNYMSAIMAQNEFKNDGQLNWGDLYSANQNAFQEGGNSIYVLAEDRNDDRQVMANSILTATISENVKFNSKMSYTQLKSENFASIKDLLGGTGYLDIDFFARANEQSSPGDRAQNDLQNRNRIVLEGERFKYNFELHARVLDVYSQFQFKTNRADFYLAGQASNTNYLRVGMFQNGSHPENSLGKSETLNFFNYGFKFGTTIRFTGRHIFDLNGAYFTKPPNLRNSFSNSRQNNEVVLGLNSETLYSGDASYIYRTTKLRTRLTGYYTQIEDATDISFYYADGLSEMGRTGSTAFVQEVLGGVGKRHAGVELGMEYQITATIKVKAAAAVGEYIYNKNPTLYLTSDSFANSINYGESSLRNYKIAGGPQRAAQIGFEYRDPNYWWFGTTVNFFSHAFADVSTLSRTSNFFTDVDGLPILNYDEAKARSLLRQEQFDNYILVNAIGGKSWRINSNYLGFFVSLNNIFDVLYKTGGYESSRNANYRSLTEDRARDLPLFGNKYWYGTGASYYANIYYRF